MSYNVKNYTEQGGDVIHIGGELVIDEDASVTGLPSSQVVVFPMSPSGETEVTVGELWELMHNQGKIVFFVKNLSDSEPSQSVIYLLRQIVHHQSGYYTLDAWDYSNLVGLGFSGVESETVSFSY